MGSSRIIFNQTEEGEEMHRKTIRLMYFSLQDSELRIIDLEWKKFLLFVSLALATVFIVSSLILGLFSDIYHNSKINSLKKENAILGDQLAMMEEKVSAIQSHLKRIEKKDDELRLVADLPKMDTDLRKVGVGGLVSELDRDFDVMPINLSKKTEKIQLNLNRLEREVLLEIKSYGEIEKKLWDNKRLIKHTPSIRPTAEGRLTANFGIRLDPFLERYTPHEGIDIAAEKGTPIYAAADGVVEEARDRYKRNRGYGKTILINHGYGFKTRYAHLSQILVKKGQKVKRWDIIGRVGDSGRTTGSHLHYEVIVNGKPVNPFSYIYNW